ncbi:BREX-1 system adenine-specific DNA-methyltransferase PglX [Thermophilibacter sp.]|uniref:BREX-1 system adenine-specific DNA-methyltransferase PglX n=1 Tax=Thermophilibacter sp. TaxID=2847309 RepID=UPI003A90736B
MDTKVLEKICPWARTRLKEGVDLRCRKYDLTDEARAAAPADADIVGGAVLTSEEKRQRAELYTRIEAHGYARLVEDMASTWFNRFVAIRYMELNDCLPCRVRMLSSAADGSFSPDCLRMATELDLPGLDQERVFRLIDKADDEGLFRLIIMAQCNELADALPDVFSRLGAADELVLPDGLLRAGDGDFLYHLVADVPEETWRDDVESLGWTYQFYNSERKDEFFKSKRKASADDLAPATQLFTPKWIVQYLVENSLGRLWMLNNPSSHLKERMKYFIEPDDEHEDFIRISGPEDITFCDPACGSGHILSYAFELLYAMYEERGYRPSEIPQLILEKNLTGFEIDERAAQVTSLVLAMQAIKHDRRFFRRGVTARIHVFRSVDCEGADLPKPVSEQLEHLGEIGSLIKLAEKDLDSIHALTQGVGESLLDNRLAESLRDIEPALYAVLDRYDVVVANPPYMGSSSFNPFMSSWIKKSYPDVKSDLCTCFIERGYDLADKHGYSSMVTMQSWMFLGSFEKMRNRLIDEKTIVSMAHLGPRAFDAIGGEVVSVTAAVLYNSASTMKSAYFRLVDIVGSEPKREKLLEAISNPTCGWFYRADASTFHDIPGTPIAYWTNKAIRDAFKYGCPLHRLVSMSSGLKTGDNARFLRHWWEASRRDECLDDIDALDVRWHHCNKGGDYRKWSGNNEYIVHWGGDGSPFLSNAVQENRSVNGLPDYALESPSVTWSKITSGPCSFRYKGVSSLPETAGPSMYANEAILDALLGLLNSSVSSELLSFLSPTLNCNPKEIGLIPVIGDYSDHYVEDVVNRLKALSENDWDINELSWNYQRNSLV